MNHIEFNPLRLPTQHQKFWNEWSKEAKAASEYLLRQSETGTTIEYKSAIWAKLKRWLLENYFMGKCGYCETCFEATDYGAADHYRPKGCVTSEIGKRSTIKTLDGRDHQGYYWVAYDWMNLIPSCTKCNTGGKLDYFPITGTRAFLHTQARDVASLDLLEKPLLLHPYGSGDDNPRCHIEFSRRGYVRAKNKSSRGKTSIQVYGLRRETLRMKRRESQANAWNRYLRISEMSDLKREKFIRRFVDAKEEHSGAVLDYFKYRVDKLSLDLEKTNPSP